jgi:hypothetical protein
MLPQPEPERQRDEDDNSEQNASYFNHLCTTVGQLPTELVT